MIQLNCSCLLTRIKQKKKKTNTKSDATCLSTADGYTYLILISEIYNAMRLLVIMPVLTLSYYLSQ